MITVDTVLSDFVDPRCQYDRGYCIGCSAAAAAVDSRARTALRERYVVRAAC